MKKYITYFYYVIKRGLDYEAPLQKIMSTLNSLRYGFVGRTGRTGKGQSNSLTVPIIGGG